MSHKWKANDESQHVSDSAPDVSEGGGRVVGVAVFGHHVAGGGLREGKGGGRSGAIVCAVQGLRGEPAFVGYCRRHGNEV